LAQAVLAHGEAVFRAEDLYAEVEAAGVVPGACDQNRQAVGHSHQDGRVVYVAEPGVAVEAPDAPHRVDSVDLQPGQPARQVEVVDVEVPVRPAARRYELLGGRLGVVGGYAMP
jgi:hypothetical protein